MKIRNGELGDWSEIERIYLEGIKTGNATFETEETIKRQAAWFAGKIKGSVFVAYDEKITGWAALSPISDRCVYSGVAEVSVYISENEQGKGIGSLLMEKLVEFAEANNIWTLQAGIFPENISSIKLHEKFGFRIVGRREKLGKLKGVWRDTLLMERRSSIVGCLDD